MGDAMVDFIFHHSKRLDAQDVADKQQQQLNRQMTSEHLPSD